MFYLPFYWWYIPAAVLFVGILSVTIGLQRVGRWHDNFFESWGGAVVVLVASALITLIWLAS